jgi:protein arginine N-methyltransferase 1
VSLVLDEHRQYLSDRHRIAKYGAALAEVVRPGMIVADVASGTGILGLLACRAGASRVYAIEAGPMVTIARQIAAANGFADRIEIIHRHSDVVELPERVDVVVSDQIGRFGFEADLPRLAADARARFLKPSGVLVPAALDLIVVPVEHRLQSARVAFWSRRPAGFDVSPARAIASNTGYPVTFAPRQLLSDPQAGCRCSLESGARAPLQFERSFAVARRGMLDGIGGWFAAQLSPSVTLTNSPIDPERIARRQVFFPIEKPVTVAEGDRVDVRMHIMPDDALVSWTVRVHAAGRPPAVFRHSTLHGMLLDRDTLGMTDPEYRPLLTEHGRARLSVLDLCNGGRTLREIETEIFARHRALFDTPESAAVFVGEVVQRYTRHGP